MQLVLRCLLLVQVQLLLQVTCVPNKGPCPECGDGWVRVKGDRFCYLHTSGNKDFAQWLTYCHEKGATLPILKTKKDQDNFVSLNEPRSVSLYIGLNRSSTSKTWMWLDNDECTLDDLQSIITPEDFKRFVDNQLNDYLTVGFSSSHWDNQSQPEFELNHKCCVDEGQCQKQCPNTTVAPPTTAKRTTAQAQGGDSGLGTWGLIGIIIAIGGVLQLLLIVYVVLHVVKQRRAAGSQSPMARQEVTAKDDPAVGISPNGAAQVDNASNASLTIPPNQ